MPKSKTISGNQYRPSQSYGINEYQQPGSHNNNQNSHVSPVVNSSMSPWGEHTLQYLEERQVKRVKKRENKQTLRRANSVKNSSANLSAKINSTGNLTACRISVENGLWKAESVESVKNNGLKMYFEKEMEDSNTKKSRQQNVPEKKSERKQKNKTPETTKTSSCCSIQ